MFRTLNLRSSIFTLRLRTVTTLPNLKPLNTKITSLMRNGLVAEAHTVFDEMPQRNTVTWNAMISGFFRNGNIEKALELYCKMPERDVFSYNTVIAGLMKFGDVNGAKGVFDRMRCKDVVTWNSMISGYFQNGFMDEALAVFGMMPFKDVISWNLVISGLVDMREIGLAEEFFKEMSERDVVSWTLMMSGFLSVGRIVEARKCFDCMPMKLYKSPLKATSRISTNKKGDAEIKGSQGSEFTFAETSKEVIAEDDVGTQENYTKEIEQMEPPQSPKMYLATGLGIDFMGGVDEEYYRIMVGEDPCNPTYLKNYAQLLQSKGDVSGAEDFYLRATIADPKDGEILIQYAKLVWELHRDQDKALTYFEKAVFTAPENSTILAAYARYLWEVDQVQNED
ncbi:pentatricopeptide repeat-containing protein [Artemisia annua]|uniref:Pentatricopeptide repeat-containing protein n=1 Tax=Artemisia annua TaxID=35608 RepID=A0A2U1KC47_ARTAN|nr:pentatricopeptide repeat-containing protein [Artemisia annua]